MHPLPTLEQSPPQGGPTPVSLIAALCAAFAGMFLWAGVTFLSGYEVGIVAWALGGLVGLASVRFGGRGVTSASVAAVLTVAGIAGGKLLGTSFIADKQFQMGCEEIFTRELHAELMVDAADFAQLGAQPGDAELRSFLFEHSYTAADSAASVSAEELQAFLSENNLRELHERQLSYEHWYTESVARSRAAFDESFSVVQANIDELNGIDVLFVFLGVSTAFGIVRRAEGQSGAAGSSEDRARQAA